MHIPFPERVPINRVAIFAVALFIIQRIEGTELYFSVGCTVFLLMSAFTFNAAGGLTRASGAYVFSYATMAVLIGVCYKAYLGEPAQSNLLDPRTDIEVYVGSMAGMFAAVTVSRRLSRKTGLLQNVLKESKMYYASIGCMLFGASAAFGIAALGDSASQIQTAFAQLNQLVPLGIIIGLMYEIRRSGGSRCTNPFIIVGTAYFFFLGATGFSKQGMIEPIYCWLLPIAALRFRLSFVQVLSTLLATFIIFYYLVPFSQYGRGFVPENSTLSQRVEIAARFLKQPNVTRRLYYQSEADAVYNGVRALSAYYNTPEGFWERLQMVSPDDALNNTADRGHAFGLMPIELEFLNAIPHVLWPGKPSINVGNMYAHEVSGESQDEGDTTTGICFSPSGEAYFLAKWVGVLVLAPLLWCLLFVVFDSLCGDLRATPWGVLAFVMVSLFAPEGGLSGLIYLLTVGAEALIFCALFATWVAPIFAIAVAGPDRGPIPERSSSPAAL